MRLTDTELHTLAGLTADYAGLKLGDRDASTLAAVIEQRLTALGLASVQDYCTLLTAAGDATIGASRQEWQTLLTQLTIGESYFFRDAKQLQLLQTQIFPQLLQAKQQAGQPLSLQVWSAGCATGEEVYSVAILLHQLKSAGQIQSGLVVGTDLNATFLAKARQGVYGSWSFRQVSPQIQADFFVAERGDRWRINPSVQTLTQFADFNLALDPIQPLINRWGAFDVIICRNVFIYFTPIAIAQTLTKFYDALAPGRYLITGHAELQGIPLTNFQVHRFPESIVYQRSPAIVPRLPAANPHFPVPERRPTTPSSLIPAAPVSFGSPPLRPLKSLPAPELHPPVSEASPLQTARTLANTGQYEAALQMCQALAKAHPLDPEPCYLLASISEEMGDLDTAKLFLKRVIYLDPQAIPAYLELAALYDRTSDAPRANKARSHVLTLLNQLPDDHVIALRPPMTVAQLRQALP